MWTWLPPAGRLLACPWILDPSTQPGERDQVDRSSGCCHCFVAGTLVSTPSGLLPIEDLRIGDLVWSKSEETGEVSAEAVTALHENAVEPIHALTTRSADGEQETIEVTAKHPYWVVGSGWLDSGALKPGMVLLSADGGQVQVVELRPLGKVQTTYNLTVANHESYFVGEQRVWVHNCGGCNQTPHVVTKDRADAGPAGKPNSIVEQNRDDGSRSVTYYDDQGRRFSREDYGQLNPHRCVSNGPDGKPVPHEHRYDYSEQGFNGKRIRELDEYGMPVSDWKKDKD